MSLYTQSGKEIGQTFAKEKCWSLSQALVFISKLEPILRQHGFHSGITGGCLYEGWSTKDLDIIIYPRKKAVDDFSKAQACIEEFLQHKLYLHRFKYDGKVVCQAEYEGKRIDFFFMS